MCFHFNWLVEGRILAVHVLGRLTDADFSAFDDALETMLSQQTTLPVHVIVDYSRLECIETLVSPTRSQNAVTLRHPRLGLRAAVDGPMLRFLPVMTGSALRPPANTFASMDEALEYLYAADPTLTTDDPRSTPPVYPRSA
jgi:hypothetical protein